MNEELYQALKGNNLLNLLRDIDSQRQWKFSKQEQKTITLMLRSDSKRATSLGCYIVAENARYAEPLMPLILEVSAQPTPENNYGTLGISGRRMFASVIENSNIAWKPIYTKRLIECLADVDNYLRLRAFEVVMKRFRVIFPDLFLQVTGRKYTDIKSATALMLTKYEEFNSEQFNGDIEKFSDIFLQKKRVLRILYVILLAKQMKFETLQKKVLFEDSYIFDHVIFRMTLGSYRKRLELK